MTKRVLILDCGCTNFGKGGNLNHYYTQVAEKEFKSLGYQVEITQVGEPWEIEKEVRKIQWADVIILQTPGWWMTTPWQFVRYMDLVFIQPGIVGNDGRHNDRPTENYGKGGILTEKRYMISSTWNAPKEAFEREHDFFEAKGIDGVFFHIHKAFQFLGMKPLPSFMANDVVKNPKLNEDLCRFKKHIEIVFA